MRKERLIWSNMDLEPDMDYIKGEYPELLGDEEAIMELTMESSNSWLDDERGNLDIQLNNDIIAIADVGRWNGRVTGYKIIESGNIKDILSSECDSVKWYSDGYNVHFIGHHHDGTNSAEYREVRDNVDIDKFISKIYNGEKISRATINYYTKSILPEVNKVYGW